jgi:hypothetical protein
MGMLAYFVNGYNSNNLLTPTYILLLFIVSVLGLVWALFTIFTYHRSSSNARFITLVDLGFVGGLIAGVYYLRFITGANCANITTGDTYDVSFGIFGSAQINGFSVSVNKTCAMLKACFALGIMNCIFFFFTACLAWMQAGRAGAAEKREHVETSRRRSGSHRRHSRSGSHHSRRSSHSHRQAYV